MAEKMHENPKSTIQDALISLNSKRQFFDIAATLSYAFRLEQLKKLKGAVKDNESLFLDALHSDLRKSSTEAYISEIGFLLNEIDEAIENLKA